MIVVNDIVKTYGDHKAVDHLSFTLEKGKIYGFLGPNGAGKSTTMNIMTGYIAATSGSVSIEGFDILKEAESAKKHIGYLPEIPPVYNDMTIGEYLEFAAELKRIPKKERRDQIAKVLTMTKLGDYRGRLIKNLSKGYKQRAGLAQALIGFPEVIILDEPTVGLDPMQIIEIRELIRSLRDDHIVILSSHILSEVNETCDEVMIISHGKMVERGTPAELEAKFSTGAKIKLSVLGTEGQVRGALSGIDNVKSITILDEKDSDGAVVAEVDVSGDEDVRVMISKAFANLGLPVLSMTKETKTLEDVFLEVTTVTPASDKAKKAKKDKKTKTAMKDIEKKAAEIADETVKKDSESKDSDLTEDKTNETDANENEDVKEAEVKTDSEENAEVDILKNSETEENEKEDK